MIGALVYLQAVMIRNAVAQRVRRLRQPRYLIGAVVGAAYFYLFFFRQLAPPRPGGADEPAESAAVGLFIGLSIAALIFAGRVVYTWVFSAGRAALSFSEAEIAFLFQAPVSRRALVNYKLLKSQMRIVLSAILFSIVASRLGFPGGRLWMQTVGCWILLSTFELHNIAASFTRERLLDLGLNPVRRRALFGGACLLAALGLGAWVRHAVPAPGPDDLADAASAIHYLQRVFAAPPVSWVLMPFAWVLRPFFAVNGAEFLRALGPALLILGGHYVWVIRTETAFEEASLELARRHAERNRARRGGPGRERPARKRREPFALRPRGPAVTAFLWRSMIAAGRWFHPVTWLYISAGAIGATLWIVHNPSNHAILVVIQSAAIGIGSWILIAGPMVMRREARLLMERMDAVKTFPLRGWQVVLGEMLASIVLITAAEWLLLVVGAVATAALRQDYAGAALFGGLGAVGIGLLVPPMVGLMTGIPFATALCFPSWMSTLNQPGAGFEVMGQRMLFAGGYLVVLFAALLPAALVGAGPFLVVLWAAGSLAAALSAGGLAASLVLFGEFAALVWWLGGVYERFDLSTEPSPS